MTDNEIIKALECCSVDPSSGKYADCKNCPLDILDSANCFWFVIQKNALDLINRQKSEIERLCDAIEKTDAAYFAKVGEVDSLKAYVRICEGEIKYTRIHEERARTEAIKEFAGRVKKHARKMQSSDFSGDFWDSAVLVETINNIIKEMVGEK